MLKITAYSNVAFHFVTYLDFQSLFFPLLRRVLLLIREKKHMIRLWPYNMPRKNYRTENTVFERSNGLFTLKWIFGSTLGNEHLHFVHFLFRWLDKERIRFSFSLALWISQCANVDEFFWVTVRRRMLHFQSFFNNIGCDLTVSEISLRFANCVCRLFHVFSNCASYLFAQYKLN